MLQHDQRYLLAEAVYFLLAFFLTLSDHRRGIAKASKVPCDARCITFLANTFERRKKNLIAIIPNVMYLDYEVYT